LQQSQWRREINEEIAEATEMTLIILAWLHTPTIR